MIVVANDGELCSAVQFYRVSLSGGPGIQKLPKSTVISTPYFKVLSKEEKSQTSLKLHCTIPCKSGGAGG